MAIFNIKTKSGRTVSYDSEKPAGKGAMKTVFFSPDKSYVVAFYKNTLDADDRVRIETIMNQYTDSIFKTEGGDYWKDVLCWMTDYFEYEGKYGIVLPTYPKRFFFEYGSFNDDKPDGIKIKGGSKKVRWFTSAKSHFQLLNAKERGDSLLKYLQICLCLSRGVQCLHKSGLAHGDLSNENVIVDPLSGTACIIDIDEVIVPGRFPPKIYGSIDYTAPEVIATNHFPWRDNQCKKPNIFTDCHALAVMIYQLLLYRHPLRGKQFHSADDTDLDDKLRFGEKALFIEHPTNASNRPYIRNLDPIYLPWADVERMPSSILGPHLKTLFDRAFIDGLHTPHMRPTADEWRHGLIRTIDLLIPCRNPSCQQKWFIYGDNKSMKCPYCGHTHTAQMPVLEFHTRRREQDDYRPENIHLVVHHNQCVFHWHINKNVFPNEKLKPEQKKPVGYFSFHQGKWVFVNQALDGMLEIDAATGEKKPVAIGSMLEIKDNQRLLLSSENGGRLAHVQMAGKQ